jgi:hypothetical protein
VAAVTALLFTGVLAIGARKELIPLTAVAAAGLLILAAHGAYRARSASTAGP